MKVKKYLGCALDQIHKKAMYAMDSIVKTFNTSPFDLRAFTSVEIAHLCIILCETITVHLRRHYFVKLGSEWRTIHSKTMLIENYIENLEHQIASRLTKITVNDQPNVVLESISANTIKPSLNTEFSQFRLTNDALLRQNPVILIKLMATVIKGSMNYLRQQIHGWTMVNIVEDIVCRINNNCSAIRNIICRRFEPSYGLYNYDTKFTVKIKVIPYGNPEWKMENIPFFYRREGVCIDKALPEVDSDDENNPPELEDEDESNPPEPVGDAEDSLPDLEDI